MFTSSGIGEDLDGKSHCQLLCVERLTLATSGGEASRDAVVMMCRVC